MTTNGKLPITAVMVIRNEEKLLERSLRSFADLVDEIVIVHDGPCADRSLEIARRYTDKIFVRQPEGTSERHRPFSYAQASHDWLLEIDPDESLSPEFRARLPELVNDPAADLYDVAWPTVHGGRRYPRGYKPTKFTVEGE